MAAINLANLIKIILKLIEKQTNKKNLMKKIQIKFHNFKQINIK